MIFIWVIDLKMKEFTPEQAGKMNFYLSAVDSLMKHPTDSPSIGLILCKTRERVIGGGPRWKRERIHN